VALGAADAEEHVRDDVDQHEQQEAATQENDSRLTSYFHEGENYEDARHRRRNEEVVDRFVPEVDYGSVGTTARGS